MAFSEHVAAAVEDAVVYAVIDAVTAALVCVDAVMVTLADAVADAAVDSEAVDVLAAAFGERAMVTDEHFRARVGADRYTTH